MAEQEYCPAISTAGLGTKDEEALRSFISGFYAVSDDPNRNDDYVDFFAPDAVTILADKTAKGTSEIRQARQASWEKVTARKHKLEKLFAGTFDESGSIEYMLNGTLDFEMKDGGRLAAIWAARARLERDEQERLRFTYYQIYTHLR